MYPTFSFFLLTGSTEKHWSLMGVRCSLRGARKRRVKSEPQLEHGTHQFNRRSLYFHNKTSHYLQNKTSQVKDKRFES